MTMPKSTKNNKSQPALFPYYANKWVYGASENLNHTKQVAKGKRSVYDDSEKLNHEKQVAMRILSNVCLNFQPSSKAQKKRVKKEREALEDGFNQNNTSSIRIKQKIVD